MSLTSGDKCIFCCSYEVDNEVDKKVIKGTIRCRDCGGEWFGRRGNIQVTRPPFEKKETPNVN
jgi:transcription elongation factor Elf1